VTGPFTVAEPSSVFTCARPSPGKCLAVAATPPERIPSIDARVRAAIPFGVPAKARNPITGAAPAGTSATGARLTLTPARASWRALARAARRTAAGSPCSGWPAEGPAQLTVRMSPPSWSTMTSALPRAGRCRERVSRRQSAGVVALRPNRITPAVSRARSRRRT
jgi:hypothetical protein